MKDTQNIRIMKTITYRQYSLVAATCKKETQIGHFLVVDQQRGENKHVYRDITI